jgi:hypothetical protein
MGPLKFLQDLVDAAGYYASHRRLWRWFLSNVGSEILCRALDCAIDQRLPEITWRHCVFELITLWLGAFGLTICDAPRYMETYEGHKWVEFQRGYRNSGRTR